MAARKNRRDRRGRRADDGRAAADLDVVTIRPTVTHTRKIAEHEPTVRSGLVTNAFAPAVALAASSNQNEMSQYEQAPTPSQPRKVTSPGSGRAPAAASGHERVRYMKNLPNAGSPFVATIEYRWIRRTDAGDEQAHGDRQRVEQEPELTWKLPTSHPTTSGRTGASPSGCLRTVGVATYAADQERPGDARCR